MNREKDSRFHPHARWLLIATLVLAALAAGAADPAGKVLFATGRADIVGADGEIRPMERGAPVFPGDELVTAQGRAQLRLTDGSSYALEPFTRFRVDEYLYEENLAVRARRAFFSLLKGGFRTITGAVGEEREDNYRVRTQLADIGIRGTIYRAGLTSAGSGSRLDVAVTRGRVFLQNDAGVLDIAAGQSGFVTGRDVLPRLSQEAGRAGSAGRGDLEPVPDVRESQQYPERSHPEPSQPVTPHPHPESYY